MIKYTDIIIGPKILKLKQNVNKTPFEWNVGSESTEKKSVG